MLLNKRDTNKAMQHTSYNKLYNRKTEKNIIQFMSTNLTQFFSSFFFASVYSIYCTFYADQNYVKKKL